jgi:hypothetical protein
MDLGTAAAKQDPRLPVEIHRDFRHRVRVGFLLHRICDRLMQFITIREGNEREQVIGAVLPMDRPDDGIAVRRKRLRGRNQGNGMIEAAGEKKKTTEKQRESHKAPSVKYRRVEHTGDSGEWQAESLPTFPSTTHWGSNYAVGIKLDLFGLGVLDSCFRVLFPTKNDEMLSSFHKTMLNLLFRLNHKLTLEQHLPLKLA